MSPSQNGRIEAIAIVAIAALLTVAPAAQARKVLTESTGTTLENTSRILKFGQFGLVATDLETADTLTTGLGIAPDGTLTASGGSVNLIPDTCFPRQEQSTVINGAEVASLEFGYTNVGPCLPGTLIRWVTHNVTGSVDPFTGSMTLQVSGHVQLVFAAREDFFGVPPASYNFSGDGCTLGTPSGDNQLLVNLSTSETWASTAGEPYDEADGTAKLVDADFNGGPINGCSMALSPELAQFVFTRLGIPDPDAALVLGVRLDPLAQRGVIAALSASPAGPGQATLDASQTQAPAGVQLWEFDLDGDSDYETAGEGPILIAGLAPGPHTVGVRVVDADGDADTAEADVVVAEDLDDGGDGGPGDGYGGGLDDEDHVPPVAEVGGPKSQTLGKWVKVKVSFDEACTADAIGKVIVKPPNHDPPAGGGAKRKAKRFKLGAATGSVPAGGTLTIGLKIAKKARRAIGKLLDKGWKAKAKIKVVATDAAGNTAEPVTGTIKIKPKPRTR